MLALPVSDVHTLEVCPFGCSIGIDDDQLGEGEDFDAFLSVEHDAEVMVVGACEGTVLAVDIIAHEQTAEM